MTSVLVVDDDNVKMGRIRHTLLACNIPLERISFSMNAHDCIQKMSEKRFDLLLLDVNLPRRIGEGPVRGGGITVLNELDRNESLLRPRYIAGVYSIQGYFGRVW